MLLSVIDLEINAVIDATAACSIINVASLTQVTVFHIAGEIKTVNTFI
jgi:hypothetical protein